MIQMMNFQRLKRLYNPTGKNEITVFIIVIVTLRKAIPSEELVSGFQL